MPASLANNFIHRAYLLTSTMFTNIFEAHTFQTEKRDASSISPPRAFGRGTEPSKEDTWSLTWAANFVDMKSTAWTTGFGTAPRELTSERPFLQGI